MTLAPHTRALAVFAFALEFALTCASPAAADPSHPRTFHISATIGWFAALTGPLPHGPAADLEIHPGGAFGRFGLGCYYRGLERLDGRGSFILGLAYDAGAARPRLQLGLHADIGYDTALSRPLIGTGLRSQFGGIGPLVVAGDLSARLYLDGIDSRLAFAFTLSAGVAR
jgi:hypothetical protein